MSAEIVGLRDAQYQPPGEANERVVAKLEAYLEQARRGEIDGIAFAMSKPNGSVRTDFYLGPTAATFRTVAAVGILSADVHAALNETATHIEPGDEDHSA